MTEQIPLAIFGIVSIWLSQSPNPRMLRYAPVWGLCAQPFGFLAAIKAEQWGMFVLSIALTICWIRGLHTYWWRK